MWSFFTKQILPEYEIGEPIDNPLGHRSLWTLKNGRYKRNNNRISVLVGDANNPKCKNSFQRLKTLKHPNILPVLDHEETEKHLYIITHPIEPSMLYFRKNRIDYKREILFALLSIAKAIKFLNSEANLIHHNVHLGSLYVRCCASEFEEGCGYNWYLGDFDYCSNDFEKPIEMNQECSKFHPNDIMKSENGDSWGFSCLLWELYNHNLSINEWNFSDTSNIDNSLIPLYKALRKKSSTRIPVLKFINEIENVNKDVLCNTMKLLESRTLVSQSSRELRQTLNTLDKVLNEIPQRIQIHGIVPLLVHGMRAVDSSSVDIYIVPLLLKIGQHMTLEDFEHLVIPTFIQMYQSTDRALRVELLLHLDKYIDFLNKNVINKTLYPLIARGMLDTHPSVREATLRSFLLLAPKLSYNILNVELLKLLALTHARDPDGTVRTNTIILLINIMPLLDPKKRGEILCGALCRAFKDNFKPARSAALSSLQQCVVYMNHTLLSQTLLPTICPMLVNDRSDQLFQVFRSIIDYLEKGVDKTIEQVQNTKSNESWSNWALSLFQKEKPNVSSMIEGTMGQSIHDESNKNVTINETNLDQIKPTEECSNVDIINEKSQDNINENVQQSVHNKISSLKLKDKNVKPFERSNRAIDIQQQQASKAHSSDEDFFEAVIREERLKKKVGKRLGATRLNK